MRRKMIRLLSCLITLSIMVFGLARMTLLMERKASPEKYADFFSQTQDFDVLFLGSSHVINAVYPMELWKDYGIVSYNLGGHSNQIATTYWTMENALDYTHPKLVVIDCLAISSNRKCSDIFSYLHLSLDAFPLNMTKIKAIWDLLDDPVLERDIQNGNARESDEPRTKIGLLWDYSVYHSRWAELSQDDFSPSINKEKGAESRIAVKRNELNKIPPSQKTKPGTTSDIYLRKMIEDCQARGISVLLTFLPFPANESQQMDANYVYDLAQEYGVEYINFLDMDIIDYQTDLYDESSHLNPSGARKITDYLGNFLVNHYGIEDQRKNDSYSSWHQDYERYCLLKNNNLVKNNNIVEYLMLLSGDDISIAMDVRNKDIFHNKWIKNLLSNIGINAELLNESTDFIIVQDKGKRVSILDNFREDGNVIKSEVGEIRIVFDTDGHLHEGRANTYDLIVNDELCLTGSIDDKTSLRINVARGHNTIDSVSFHYTVDPDTTIVNTSSVERDAHSM